MKVTNNRASEIHCPHERGKPRLTLAPGVNDVDASLWEAAKKTKFIQACLDEDLLVEGGKVKKEKAPTLTAYVRAGYEPKGYLKQFPGVEFDDEEMDEYQKIWDDEKASATKAKADSDARQKKAEKEREDAAAKEKADKEEADAKKKADDEAEAAAKAEKAGKGHKK